MRGLLTLTALACLAFGAIPESDVNPDLIKERIETNCPSDPTFGGQCYVTDIQEGAPGCRTIDGVEFCRSWWERKLTYKCDGDIDVNDILNTFTSQKYCWYERKCANWADIQKNGGVVTCRVYYDTLKPGCADNPYQAKCITDDCGDLFKYCTLKNYVPYGDIRDAVNTEPQQYCDPVYGYCGEVQVPGKSGVSVGTYSFECSQDVRKVCTSWEIVKNCPDGMQSICNTIRTCTKQETSTITAKENKSCIVDRPYTEYRVIKGSQEAASLKNNPLCIKVGEESTPCDRQVRNYSGGSICELTGRYSSIGGNSGTITIERNVEVPAGTDLALYLYVGNSCDDDNTRVDLIVKDSNTGEVIGEYHNSCNHSGKIVTIYKNTPSNLKIDYKYRVTHCTGSYCGANDYSFTDGETSSSWNYGGGTWDSHTSTFGWMVYTHEIYRCYDNSINTATCNMDSECTLISNLSDLSSLSCYAFAQDIEQQNKMVCSRYSIFYECPTTKRVVNCTDWSEQINCQDGTVVIPQITARAKDFSDDFLQAVGLAQAANELKHVWTGKSKVCEDGWWSSIVSNPTQYFINKAVSYAIARFGADIASAATEYFQAASFCLNPAYAVAGADGIGDCMATVAESSYTGNGGVGNAFLNKVCNNSPSFCGAAEFLSDPAVQFAISVAVDVVTTTEDCSTCTSEKCAVKHGQYEAYALINGRQCHYVASKCTWKIDFGFTDVCLRSGYKYCCYDSVFTRILVEQAYKQLGYGWGSWDSPNCGALTFDDLKKLDFSAMDFSELQAYIEAKMKTSIPQSVIKNKIEQFYQGTDTIDATMESPYGTSDQSQSGQ